MPEQDDVKLWHKKFTVECFNGTWDLIDKKEQTREEIDKMIHCAHASRYHWGEVGEPLNLERGEWQISRVYAILGRAEPALYHSKRCLDIVLENNIGDFDLAFAYEAMARAHKLSGNIEEMHRYIEKALKASENIKEKEDRDYAITEINSIKA